MIWSAGRLMSADSLMIPAIDRTFEHGLGLFETLRTFGGAAPLLDRHLIRLRASAGMLGLPIDPAGLPDAEAVGRLVAALGPGGDVLLRITLSGGTSADSGSTLWMRGGPLPTVRPEGVSLDPAGWDVLWDDPMARHKALNYWSRRIAHERAVARGHGETLSRTPDGRVWEGARTNLFVVRGSSLTTPPAEGPIVPGIMRAEVLALGRSLGMDVAERDLTAADVVAADEVFLTNSVRGIVPVRRIGSGTGDAEPGDFPPRDWPDVPGPWTCQLRDALAAALERPGSIG